MVDDNPADAQLFEVALKQASTRVRIYWVASGEEALDFLHQRGRFQETGTVKLVVLDLNLPGQHGFEILRTIKTDGTTVRMPVIIFTSSFAVQDVDRAYALGANAYFSKPMSLELYIEKVRTITQHWLDLCELPSF